LTIDPLTAAALPRSLPTFRKIAIERIREEFSKLLLSSRPRFGIELLRSTGLLEVFLPELLEGVGQEQSDAYADDVFGHAIATVEAAPADLVVRLAALLHDVAKPRTADPKASDQFPGHEILGAEMATGILERLKFPRKTIDAVAGLVRHHRLDHLPDASDGDLRRFLAAVGVENIEFQLALAEANWRGRGKGVDQAMGKLLRLRSRIGRILSAHPPLDAKALALDGNEIMAALGIGPSAAVGEASRFLLDRVLESPELNTPGALAALLRKWAQSKSS